MKIIFHKYIHVRIATHTCKYAQIYRYTQTVISCMYANSCIMDVNIYITSAPYCWLYLIESFFIV